MKFVDAHIHLSDAEYDQKVDGIIEDARRSNVVALVSNSMNLQTSILSLKLADQYPGVVFAALGIHPWNVRNLTPEEIRDTENLIRKHGAQRGHVVAVGEIGLDSQYAKSKRPQDLQLQVFHEMLRVAEELSLPVVIHSRGTAPQIVGILPSYSLKGVLFHWFSRPIELIPKIVECGHHVSEGPPSLYSSRVREIIKRTPVTNLLTETDGPVRFWGPFKDKMTTPSFIPDVVEAIAEIKGMKKMDVADQILQNFANFFGIALS